MQISSSPSAPKSLQASQGINTQQHAERQRVALQLEKDKAEKQPSVNQPRFDIDEDVIALVEKEFNLSTANQTSDKGLTTSKSVQQQANGPKYDQPSRQNRVAVAAYQAVDNLDNRASIQDVFGVSLFA